MIVRFAGMPDEHRVLMAALATGASPLRCRLEGFKQTGRVGLVEWHWAKMETAKRLHNDARHAQAWGANQGGAPPVREVE